MERINIIGIYDDPDVLLSAAKKLKEKDVRIKNVFSPFPIHELWDVLGLKTRLPVMTFIYGTIGIISIYAFLYWTAVVNYQVQFGGKPLNTLSFIIIMFVGTIFISVLLTFTTFFIRQKIGPGKKVVMIDPRTTDDKFAIVIEKPEDMSEDELRRITTILQETGAVEINEKVQPEHYIEEEND